MSYKISKVSKNIENKPYCKVCHDAGKDESEFRSHSVRSKPDYYGKSVVICPTLLATECTYCYKHGHTVKFCPVITANKKQLNKAQNNHLRKEAEEKDKKKKVSKPKSGFAVLADSSDSEKEVKKVAKIAPKIAAKSDAKIANQLAVQSVIKMDEFPALSSTKIEVKPTVITGWAAITAKSAEQFQDEKMMQEIMEKSIKRMQPPIMKAKIVPQVTKSWADYTESDDYDEEEEEKYTQYKNPYDEEEEDW
jgi:hypothetical protein